MLLPRASEDLPETVDLNITPLIDVMLVLLVIFMVAAPLSTVDIPVELPSSSSQPAKRPEDPKILTLSDDGALRLGDRPVARSGLAVALAGTKPDEPIFLAADRSTDYGALMEVMDLLRSTGHEKVTLVGLEAAAK